MRKVLWKLSRVPLLKIKLSDSTVTGDDFSEMDPALEDLLKKAARLSCRLIQGFEPPYSEGPSTMSTYVQVASGARTTTSAGP
mmetsp:Transcript_55351/g.96591  ORF Transcript_55351/g.96591 Transcript_55351/m.96591 type:complete len:83 (-) Transcript_55351:260-508(-)